MTNETYLLELTERDIKDMAETKAGRKVVRKMQVLLLTIAVVIPLAIIPIEIFELSPAPFFGGLIVLLVPLYFWMVKVHKKQTKIIFNEFMNK